MSRKPCPFHKKQVKYIDYKDTATLSRYMTQWSKIKSGRETGVCSRHQRQLTQAVKHARHMGLLAFTPR